MLREPAAALLQSDAAANLQQHYTMNIMQVSDSFASGVLCTSVVGKFGSLIGRFNSLFGRLGNCPAAPRYFNDLRAPE
jgi:hypothetical protein